MKRREFLKKGTAAVMVAHSNETLARNSAARENSEADKSETPAGVPPAYESESSLVTQAEMDLATRWLGAIDPLRADREQSGPWLSQWLSTDLPFSFRYGGEHSGTLLRRLQIQAGGKRANSYSEQTEFTWTDPSSGLRVLWATKRFLHFPAVEWVLWFENLGQKDSLVLENICDLELHLKHSQEKEPYLVHGAHGGRYKRDDWWPFSRYLPSAIGGAPDYEDGRVLDLGGAYPSSRRNLPFVNIETPEKRGVIVGVGWTGNWTARLSVEGPELTATVGLKEGRFILRPGERVRMARILLLFWEGKRLHGQNMLRQLLHKHYIPSLKGKPQEPLVSVNTCFTYKGAGLFLTKANQKNVLPLVTPFHHLGAELLIVDAGWYPGSPWIQWMGDWTYSKERYPNGFLPLSKALAAAGMDFGLWFAPECVSEKVPLFHEHPEWLTKGPSEYGGDNLRLELPEARQWFLNQVDYMIEHQGMTCYRQDGYNREASLEEGESDDRKGMGEIKYIMALYSMLDEMKHKHPDLIMEAALGAPRIDLETLSRFHWHQPCETWLHPEWDHSTVYGTSLWLPGGMIVFYNQFTDDYGAWSRFGGQLSLAWDPLDSSFPKESARRQVNLYKRVRAFLSGDFYPLTPLSLDGTWMGYQFHRRDLDSGFALVFKRFNSPQVIYSVTDTFAAQLRGLAPRRYYQVSFGSGKEERTLTGDALAKGIAVTLANAPSAEMIVYQAAERRPPGTA